MIRLRMDDDSLGRVRLALSPLWETIGSLAILARYPGEAPSPYSRWARAVRGGMPRELVKGLVEPLRRADPPLFPPGSVPLPSPDRGTLAAELEELRRRYEGHGADELCTLLERYWDWAIAPHWARMRASLEEEALFRGRTLVVSGPEAMLEELDGRVLWSRPVLTAPFHCDLDVSVTRSQLLLVPTVFAGGVRLFQREPGVVALSYQARATGFFQVLTASERVSRTGDRLAILLGSGRAQVVRALEVPQTTTAVAASLGMAKSTVSQHLTVLSASGLVWKQRLGGRVFYQLDRGGVALLERLGL
ncbi:helix-turn-helix transcriptional regulator [Lentzea sp. HUAS12]|uniref:ArsR/SmtB family transcription factor n=1 Tax=Lentzea sp. HUAS12 TaxID=2951806 RepID=UPI0020A00CEE|nr:helix-turn-helix domain-containing protein [Lentzea sp. HUAS12]USX56200.1 helix-turn-helix domain-containing protein [Lentzea sp. HUAS12]